MPVRKRSTHAQDRAWLRTVARAAPRTPRFSTNRNSGSSRRFRAAPKMVVIIPTRGKPWALMKPLSPVESMMKGVPIR